MTDERYTFTQARARLEDIVVQVRKKDCSLEQSLELLEEGVRLANVCTELSDHTEWASAEATVDAAKADGDPGQAAADVESAGDDEESITDSAADEDPTDEPEVDVTDVEGDDQDVEGDAESESDEA